MIKYVDSASGKLLNNAESTHIDLSGRLEAAEASAAADHRTQCHRILLQCIDTRILLRGQNARAAIHVAHGCIAGKRAKAALRLIFATTGRIVDVQSPTNTAAVSRFRKRHVDMRVAARDLQGGIADIVKALRYGQFGF
jgi:hypothetical protein